MIKSAQCILLQEEGTLIKYIISYSRNRGSFIRLKFGEWRVDSERTFGKEINISEISAKYFKQLKDEKEKELDAVLNKISRIEEQNEKRKEGQLKCPF